MISLSPNLLMILILVFCFITQIFSQIIVPPILPSPQYVYISELGTEQTKFYINSLSMTSNTQTNTSANTNLQSIYNQYLNFYSIDANVTGGLDLVLNLNLSNAEFFNISNSTSEQYLLNFNDNQNQVSVHTDNYYGAIRSIDTFFQLLYFDNVTSNYFIYYPIMIQDFPNYIHRGIMIDTSRHFIPKSALLRQIDAMMYNKLNVLHWHITDSDSFPLYLPSNPNITLYGAFSPEEIYKQEDVAYIVDYAMVRGVRIIPEVDSPGHSHSWSLSPDLTQMESCPQLNWSICDCEPPAGQINPTLNITYDVVKGIIQDLENYFPDGTVHFGGDEVNPCCWNQTDINDFMTQNNLSSYAQLQMYYQNKARAMLNSTKQAMYWSIPSQLEGLSIPEGDIAEFWGQYEDLKNNASQYLSSSNPVVLAPYDYLYLDCGYSNQFGQPSYCAYNSWLKILEFNPKVGDLQYFEVLGAEVALWAEVNDEYTLDQKMWPRACSLAERLWNNDKYGDVNFGTNSSNFNNVTLLIDATQRLVQQQFRLNQRGINAQPITSEYCSYNEAQCFLP